MKRLIYHVEMESPLLKHHPLRFAEYLPDSHFEEICRDVWEKDYTIRRAELHGRKGQKQRGVDIIGRRVDGRISVGSCKNYRKFEVRDLDSAVEQFWEFKAMWKRLGAVELVIFIGSSKQDEELQAAVLSYAQDFSLEEIDLQLWDNRDITDELRKHRDVGIKHFDPRIQADLYGTSAEVSVTSPSESGANLGMTGGLQQITLEFASEVEAELPNLRKKARSGRWSQALEEVESLIASPRWGMLDPLLRSRVLVLSAGLHLDATDDLVGARARISLARDADPTGKFQVVESVIAMRGSGGSEEALRLLNTPESTDAWNIKLSILINLGRSDEVLETMESLPFEPNSGTHRVASLAAVVQGNFIEARKFSARAVTEAPDAFHVRQLHASLQYLEAVLPSFKDSRFLDWPVPPDWEFVLSHEGALSALIMAESTFAALLEVVEGEGQVQVHLEGWRLGCLANHPARQEEAASYAVQLLARDPCHLPALVWSLVRGFPFDHEKSRNVLSMAVRTGGNREMAHALCHLHIISGDNQAAADLLDRSQNMYEEPAARDGWRHLRVQLAVALDDEALLTTLMQEEPDVRCRAQLDYVASRVKAAKLRDPEKLMAAALTAYEATEDPWCLFEACEAALLSGDHGFAADRAAELLSKLPSSASLQVAAHATLEAGHFAQMLELMEKHLALIPEGERGNPLRQLKVQCQIRRGDSHRAIQDAEDLARHDHALSSQLILFSTQIQGADLRGGTKTARALMGHPDIAGIHLLKVAQEVAFTDEALASHAIEKAIEKGVPDAALGDLVSALFRLGMDEVAGPHLARMAAYADQAGSLVKRVSLQELQDVQQEQVQRAREFFTAYRKGDVPLHFGEDMIGPSIFRLLLPRTFYGPQYQPEGILVRSGNHEVRSCEISKGGLFMDFTALLMAHRAGILELIEKEFAPILISAHSLKLFHDVAKSITVAQPKAVEGIRKVLALVDEEIISIAADEAVPDDPEVDSSILDITPVRWICSLAPVAPISGSQPLRLSADELASLADSLPVTASAAVAVQENVNGEVKVVPDLGDRIDLESGVATKLARNGVLDSLAGAFCLRIRSAEKVALQEGLDDLDLSETQAKILLSLADGIQGRFASQVYQFVKRDEDIAATPGEAIGAATMALHDMGLAGDQGADLVWCDDRFVNGFNGYENAKIVGISEVLALLRKNRKLSKDRYFHILSQLRAANYRYLPISDEEVIWCLAKSGSSSRPFSEGEALGILRRYLASCVLDVPSLKRPIPSPAGGTIMEYRWMIEAFKAVTGAIGRIWSAKSSPGDFESRQCDYLLYEFFMPLSAVFELASIDQSPQQRIDGLAAAIGALMGEGFGWSWPEGIDPHRREHLRAGFYDWISARLLEPTAKVEPELIQSLARIEAEALSDLAERDVPEERALKACLARAVLDLPDILKSNINFDQKFRRWIGAKKGNWLVVIGGVKCDGSAIWRAVSRLQQRESVMVKQKDGDGVIEFSRMENWSPSRRLRISGGNLPAKAKFSHAALPVVLLNRDRVRKLIFKRSDWFDVCEKERSLLIRRITAEKDPARRVEKFLDARSRSLESLYVNVGSRVRSRKDLTVEELIPASLESLASHLRLTSDEVKRGEFNLNHCALRLIFDIGLARAAQRFIHLPIPLPEALLAGVDAADDRILSFVMNRLVRTARHPLAKIQAAHLFAAAGVSHPKWADRARESVRWTFGTADGMESWTLYEKILNWTFSAFGALACFREGDYRLRLLFSWLHAGRIADVLLSNEVALEDAGDIFRSHSRSMGLEIGAWDPSLWDDCMHPRFAQRDPVLFAALASVVGRLPAEVGESLKSGRPFGSGSGEGDDLSGGLLFRDRSLMQDTLGSFLGGEARADYRHAMAADFREHFQTYNASDLWPAYVEQLEENPGDLAGWGILNLIIGDLPVPQGAEARIKALLSSGGIGRVIADSPSDQAAAVLRFAASRVRFNGGGDSEAFVSRMVAARLKKVTGTADADALRFEVTHLASCFMGMAVVPGDEQRTYTKFFKLLSELLLSWPPSGKVLGPPLWTWPNSWPLHRQSGYWQFEMTRRATSSQ